MDIKTLFSSLFSVLPRPMALLVITLLVGCTTIPGYNQDKMDDDDSAEDSDWTDDDSATDDDTGDDDDSATPVANCDDGLDNDGDGWYDVEDPDCADGDEEIGFGDSECNDGLDNDSDGFIDSDDPECMIASDVESDDDPDECDYQTEWANVPFQIKDYYVDHSVASYVDTDWNLTGLDYVDVDIVQMFDASVDSVEVDILHPDSETIEDTIYVPMNVASWYGIEDNGGEYDNGLYLFLQPDSSVLEVNYFSYSGGVYRGYVLPDPAYTPFTPCDIGWDDEVWYGAHGGSHITASQAVRPGELITSQPIGRPLPIEIDNNHLYYMVGEIDGKNGYTGWAASADSCAANSGCYTGAIPELQMGSFLVLENGYDCTTMQTVPAKRLCEVLRDHSMFVVDDSYGDNEMQLPVTEGVVTEVYDTFGINLINAHSGTGATQDYYQDWVTLMANVKVLANYEDSLKTTQP